MMIFKVELSKSVVFSKLYWSMQTVECCQRRLQLGRLMQYVQKITSLEISVTGMVPGTPIYMISASPISFVCIFS